MLEQLAQYFVGFISTIDMNSALLLFFIVGFAFVFWKEHRNKESSLNWTDILLDKKENRLSLTKLGQFWGIAISSWIAVYLTQKLTSEQIGLVYPYVIGIWLTFLVASQSVKTWMVGKDKFEVHKKDNE